MNKRILKYETMVRIFNDSGLEGLTNHVLTPDILYINGDNNLKIVEILRSNKCDTKKSLEIKKIINEQL